MENISEHISYIEAVKTGKPLINKPSKEIIDVMKITAQNVFEPLRQWYDHPIIINSFFRSIELNRAVGGAKNSQHTKGEAIDLTAPNRLDNRKLFFFIQKHLEFDQLIWEKGNTEHPAWIHVSFRSNWKNRNQVIYNL